MNRGMVNIVCMLGIFGALLIYTGIFSPTLQIPIRVGGFEHENAWATLCNNSLWHALPRVPAIIPPMRSAVDFARALERWVGHHGDVNTNT